MSDVEIVTGDLLDQPVSVIVNAWNANIFSWRLLRPRGVSGAIKRRGGTAPFKALARSGRLKLGQAVITTPGNLPHHAIIHVASVTPLGRTNPTIIRDCVQNALDLAQHHDFASIAMPILGSGSGGMDEEEALDVMLDAIEQSDFDGKVIIVKFRAIADRR